MAKVGKAPTKMYFQIMRWVWQDALRPYVKDIRWIVALQVISVLANFGAFAVLYFYVSKLEKELPVNLLGYTFEPRESQMLLLLVASAVGLLFLTTALLDFGFHKYLININKRFEKSLVTRLYNEVMAKAHLLSGQDNPDLSPYNIRKSLIKDSKFYGRTLFSTVRSVVPLIRLLFSLIFLFYLAFWFTLMVLAILMVGVVFIFQVSRTVARQTSRKEKYIKLYVQELAAALSSPMEGEELVKQRGAHNYFDAFYAWMLNAQKNRLVINLLIAVITTVLLLVVGYLALFGSTPWALLVGYLLGLRYFLASLRGINGMLKQLSTFYEYIRNYYAILSGLAELQGEPALATDPLGESAEEKGYFQFQPDDDGDDMVDDF